jgi:hypothetical protein
MQRVIDAVIIGMLEKSPQSPAVRAALVEVTTSVGSRAEVELHRYWVGSTRTLGQSREPRAYTALDSMMAFTGAWDPILER